MSVNKARKSWISALASGHFRQNRNGNLVKRCNGYYKYSPIGLAVRAFAEYNSENHEISRTAKGFRIDGVLYTADAMPGIVAEWLGINDENPLVGLSSSVEGHRTLYGLNQDLSLSQVAEVLQNELSLSRKNKSKVFSQIKKLAGVN